jgi:tetratricopeptide (TPR) repeat protein
MKRLMVIVTVFNFTFLPRDVAAYNGSNGDFDLIVTVPEGLNLRSGPGTQYETLGIMAQGDILTRLGYTNGWYEVKTVVGLTGWVCEGEDGEIWIEPLTYDEDLLGRKTRLDDKRKMLVQKKDVLARDLKEKAEHIKVLKEDMYEILEMIEDLARYGRGPGGLDSIYSTYAYSLIVAESEYKDLQNEITEVDTQIKNIEREEYLIELTYDVRPKAYEAAVEYYEKGMYSESLSELDRIKETLYFDSEDKSPADSEIYLLLGKLYRAKENYREALNWVAQIEGHGIEEADVLAEDLRQLIHEEEERTAKVARRKAFFQRPQGEFKGVSLSLLYILGVPVGHIGEEFKFSPIGLGVKAILGFPISGFTVEAGLAFQGYKVNFYKGIIEKYKDVHMVVAPLSLGISYNFKLGWIYPYFSFGGSYIMRDVFFPKESFKINSFAVYLGSGLIFTLSKKGIYLDISSRYTTAFDSGTFDLYKENGEDLEEKSNFLDIHFGIVRAW